MYLKYIRIMIPLLCAAALAQHDGIYGHCDSDVFSVLDRHYQGVLFPEVYKNLAGTKIRYPGLWTAERNSFAAGAQTDRFGEGGGWRGLYAWTDLDNGPGTAGLWVGELDFGNEQRYFAVKHDSAYYMDASAFSLRGAVWITPFRSRAFRGLSISFDIDNVFAYDGNQYMEYLDKKRVYVNVTSLVRLTDNYHLRTGIRTYNKQTDDPGDLRFDNCKTFTDGVFVGLVDDQRRTLELGLDNSYGVLYSGTRSDTVTVSLQHTQGGALSHMKHLLFLGVKAKAAMSFPSAIKNNTGTFEYGEYFGNLTGDGRVLHLSAAAPLILDIHVIGSMRAMLSAGPQISYTSFALTPKQHLFKMDMPHAEVSLRGGVGEKFDFALKPTVNSDVLISALEVRYKF